MNDVRPGHPEAQTMAAFIEGVLAPDEIAAVAEHLRGCGDCRTVVAETARFEREEARRAPAPVNRWWLLAAAAVLAAIAIIVPLRWMTTRNASPIDQLIAAAPRQHRFVEARLSGFPWAQLQAPPRGEALDDAADLILKGAAGAVLRKTADQQQPESRHAKGVAYLLIERRSESITTLEQAANGSNDPHAWNDLAAARYAVAIQDEHPWQLPLALADADHALRLDPKDPEALFNRALILDHLGVRDQARKAWLAYLAVDSGSAWSVEARSHLHAQESTSRLFDRKLLETEPVDQLVREFPEDARRNGETTMLASWANAEAAGDAPGAAAKLTRIRALANALAAFKGERLLQDAVAAIDHSSGDGRAALVSGQRIYLQARVDYANRQLSKSGPQFRRAAELFARAGSPMAHVANYYAAQTVFDQNRGDPAREELLVLLSKIDAGRYRALAAEIHGELTVCANSAGDWGTAAREAAAASAIFRDLGERESAAVTDGAAAIALDLTGEADAAWGHRFQCFAQLDATNRQKLRAALRASASTLAAVGQTAAAASIINLTVDGQEKNNALYEADAARFFARNGDFEQARQSLQNARSASSSISDAAHREFVNRQIDLADGSLNAASDARTAIGSLDRSIDFFNLHQASVDLTEAYLLRARAERSIGDNTHALADLTSALREVEKQRATIQGAEFQARCLDVAGQVIEETIDLRLAQGDVQGAFDVADQSRQQPRGLTPVPRTTARTQNPDIAVVEYAVLPHDVIAFSVTRFGLAAHRVKIERRDLENKVIALADLVRRRAPIAEITSAGALLHRLLIEPMRARLAGEQEIVFVPDHELFALPFAALWDDERKKYLTEEFTIRFAPSATSQPESPSVLQPALVVADPWTPLGARLPASREEAAHIAALYPGTTMLTDEAATPAAFADAARGSALIHFAGHANSDSSASYSALLFAADGNKPGVLGSNEVARLRLDRNPLVVLAGCGTFRGDTSHVAGMTSLASAFLTAGARAVIATLWEIDDDVSARLFQRFHEHLRAGASPATALRMAQGDLLHSTDPRIAHPATWAAAETLSN